MSRRIHVHVKSIWYFVIFLILSLMFYHVELSLFKKTTAFNLSVLKNHFENEIILIGFLSIVILFTLKVSKISKYLIVPYILIITGKSIHLLAGDFNKVILFMIFIYIIISYYFYVFWCKDLYEAYYNPLLDSSDLITRTKYKINVNILELNKKDRTFQGYLTNWSENGCFLKTIPDQNITDKSRVSGPVEIQIMFQGKKFHQHGIIVSSFANFQGLGIKFLYEENDEIIYPTWKELYSILDDMGYLPEYFA